MCSIHKFTALVELCVIKTVLNSVNMWHANIICILYNNDSDNWEQNSNNQYKDSCFPYMIMQTEGGIYDFQDLAWSSWKQINNFPVNITFLKYAIFHKEKMFYCTSTASHLNEVLLNEFQNNSLLKIDCKHKMHDTVQPFRMISPTSCNSWSVFIRYTFPSQKNQCYKFFTLHEN